MKILMIGPDRGKDSGGGVATFISSIVPLLVDEYSIKRVRTLSDRNMLKRLYDFGRSMIEIICHTILREGVVAHVHIASRWSFRRKSFFIKYLHFRKIPIILHLHGGEFHIFYEQESTPKQQDKIKNIFLMCDDVIVLSKSHAKWCCIHIQHPNIYIVYNGSKDYLKRDNQISKRDNLILFIGKIDKGKGVYDLLRAFKKINKKYPDTKLIVAGDGELSTAKELVDELNIRDSVEFNGWIGEERKTELLNRAKIFILPSYNEGQPIGVLEAMSAKLAIVSTPVGGIPETIQNRKNGLLIPPGGVDEMESAMEIILSDDKYCDFLSQNARFSYQSRFSLEVVCIELMKIYEGKIDNV